MERRIAANCSEESNRDRGLVKNFIILQTMMILIMSCGVSTSPPHSPPTLTDEITPPADATTLAANISASPVPETPSITTTPGPLLELGPWILFVDQNGEMVISNWDGSGSHPIESPALSRKGWVWDKHISPHGGYLLLRTEDYGKIAFDLTDDPSDYQMVIIKLPERKIVQTIPILSAIAREAIEIEHEKAKKQPFYILPTVLGVARDRHTYQWSPDGRYLAFSAALDSINADVYIYDTQEDVIKRLTRDQHEAVVWSWSPDSQWIVYQEASVYEDTAMFSEMKGIWAVKLTGEIQFLYKPAWLDKFGEWTSDQSFIVYEWAFEAAPCRLREIDISTHSIQELYSGCFANFTFNPENHSTIVNLSDGVYWNFKTPDGLYGLDAEGQLSTPLVLGNFERVVWNPNLNRYIARSVQSEIDQSSHRVLLLDSSGKLDLEFNGVKQNFVPSPNGAWIIVGYSTGNKLYNSTGELIKDIGIGDVYWLTDSSGFYRLDVESCQANVGGLYLHTSAQSWEPVGIDNNVTPCSVMLINP